MGGHDCSRRLISASDSAFGGTTSAPVELTDIQGDIGRKGFLLKAFVDVLTCLSTLFGVRRGLKSSAGNADSSPTACFQGAQTAHPIREGAIPPGIRHRRSEQATAPS
jgi:hypothetical protein